MILYHLTDLTSARRIVFTDGEIKTTWPHTLSAAWPIRVVWLTADPDPGGAPHPC